MVDSAEEIARASKHAVADAAHVAGLTAKELAKRAASSQQRGTARRSQSAGRADRESLAKSREATLTATAVGRSATPAGRTTRGATSAAPAGLEDTIPHAQVTHLKGFLTGATAAQRAQITMIRNVFETMDADKDGLLSKSDVRAYFRAVGRNASDADVRRWIDARDVDNDGAVSLSDFVSSYTLQLDPRSRYVGPDGRPVEVVQQSTELAEAFGALRLGGTVRETIGACDAADEYVRRVLDSPSVKQFWSIGVNDEKYNLRIGRLFGGTKLMQALGFVLESNGSVLALRDPRGKEWETVPQDVRKELNQRLEELQSHRSSLLEPSISNIAAGKPTDLVCIPVSSPFPAR
jgi:hypothetical protein